MLASASSARALLFDGAGLDWVRDPAAVDEREIKEALRDEGADAAAAALAEAKAKTVAPRYPGAFVVGADQILECDGVWYDKPADNREAARHLTSLAGRAHRLVTAACVVRDDATVWKWVEAPRLTMRPLDDAAIERYLERAGAVALESVGAYRLEGTGVQLFEAIDGDYFAILGLPLLPLLAFLRAEGAIDG